MFQASFVTCSPSPSRTLATLLRKYDLLGLLAEAFLRGLSIPNSKKDVLSGLMYTSQTGGSNPTDLGGFDNLGAHPLALLYARRSDLPLSSTRGFAVLAR